MIRELFVEVDIDAIERETEPRLLALAEIDRLRSGSLTRFLVAWEHYWEKRITYQDVIEVCR
jgi:hypothetical protein